MKKNALHSNPRFRFWYGLWFALHGLAALFSFSRIDFFNAGSLWSKSTDEFWPFVEFYSYSSFKGIFIEYDWTEFVFYTLTPLVFLFLKGLYSKAYTNQEVSVSTENSTINDSMGADSDDDIHTDSQVQSVQENSTQASTFSIIATVIVFCVILIAFIAFASR